MVGGFFPGPSISSTNKIDHHDITEKMLKVTLNTTNTNKQTLYWSYLRLYQRRFDDILKPLYVNHSYKLIEQLSENRINASIVYNVKPCHIFVSFNSQDANSKVICRGFLFCTQRVHVRHDCSFY
jgi:hypothetical protein